MESKAVRSTIGILILCLGVAGAQVPELSGVSIVTTPVAEGVYMLEATGDVAGNIAVSVGEDGILIVDDQFSGLASQILAALADIDSGALQYILNTHHHDDHSDGNAALAARTDATVIAHDRTRIRLLGKQRAHWPLITFSERLSIHFNGETITAVSLPGGHTDNDSVIFFESANVVHLGDLFNSGRTSFPLADLSAGGNALQILENINQILPLIPADAKVIAGHGPLSDRNGVVELRDMLSFTIDFVRRARLQGKSLETIKAQGFPEQYDDWNKGYTSAADWIEMIFKSLP